ncbi:hypothetical protein [Elizabethkingia anophelis]|uniref:hypothetical protein n=1 Tax=Elizabethkingia anophelis TaxID=1117645 RepID=UPI0024E1AA28|nr:hypothetical protein [Elizabethkingia anophelis]MCT4162134.1 hypothetical protein [Elizabethkingia anophelis]CAH1144050.1 hypothetical protein EAVNVB490_01610 [Elizabethkingia anophelis]CAI9670533.1 hypothetical protein EAVNNN508_01609 [Elizabethkingia anophelis]CAI9673191.1 hypothetical protein EAVNVB490_00553 [Elizabethkingia anophelis]CAI9678087.1 hypothetical protein EAVNNN508_00551 [Elizabethkingia anophelis]
MEYQNEKQIADRAVQMLSASLRSKTSSFADHVNRTEGDVSLKDAEAKATVKKYGNRREGNQKFYMKKLSIRMGKHGFIQQYGVDTTRSGGYRTRKHPRETTYGFKAHYFGMRAQPFINEAIEQSGVIPFVMEKITSLRSEEIIVNIKRIIENP